MRGYFGIGVEGISKPRNLGALLRTAHAFGASFTFTIGAAFDAKLAAASDTAESVNSVPFHAWPDLDALDLPHGCKLVGLELVEDAIELPSFRHPTAAAYVLGAERASLSPALVERCNWVIRIPGKFCVNLAVAGAITMYDRMISMGRFAERPVRTGGPTAPRAGHIHGAPLWQTRKTARRKAAAD
jgi:tRNA G18 (ribose-2'-O)-methylase SpoU